MAAFLAEVYTAESPLQDMLDSSVSEVKGLFQRDGYSEEGLRSCHGQSAIRHNYVTYIFLGMFKILWVRLKIKGSPNTTGFRLVYLYVETLDVGMGCEWKITRPSGTHLEVTSLCTGCGSFHVRS